MCYLRTTRRLEARMVVTVEPGCYFINPIIVSRSTGFIEFVHNVGLILFPSTTAVQNIALTNPTQAQYFNVTVLERFRNFGIFILNYNQKLYFVTLNISTCALGGIRLEDDVLVTATGMENFTILPSTVEEIEAVMSGQE